MASLGEKLGLNAREQRNVTLGLVVIGLLLILGIPLGMQALVFSRQSDIDDLRGALNAIQGARAQVRERQEKKAAITQRYAQRAPALAGFLEQSARSQKLEVTDSQDQSDLPHGKRYVERGTKVRLKKAGMGAILRFMESIAQSNYPITISRLAIRKRTGEPDAYDVEVGASAFDRNAEAPKADADKGGSP